MKVASNRLWTGLALCVLVGVLACGSVEAGLFGIWGSRKKASKIQRQSLVIFPFDRDSNIVAPKDFGEYIASDVRTMLTSNERYTAYLFRNQLPPIQRASGDGTLKTDDMPYEVDSSGSVEGSTFAESRAKTLRLAQLLCTDYYLVGVIDEMNVQAEKKRADITLRADLYDARTGKLVKTFLITGQSPESATTGDEDELRDMAKGSAVTKLMAELGASEEAVAPAPAVTTVGTAAPAPETTTLVPAPPPETTSDNTAPPDKPSK